MSFILDALRKADAERERDPARGIHAQTAPLPTGTAASASVPGWVWALGGVLVAGVVGYVAWPRAQPAPVAAPLVVAPVVAAPAAAPAVAATPSVAPAAAVQPAPPPVAVAPVAAPVPHTATQAASPTPPRVVASVPTQQAVAAAVPERVLPQAELPPDVQRDLPKVALSGGVYSDNAAQRFVLVNGQLAHEGTEVAPGVMLEQIRPRSAVLRYRQWRYSVAF